MKKLFWLSLSVVLLLGLCVSVYAADSKVTALSAATSATDDDLLYMVDDPSGTPASKKITVANVRKAINASIGAVFDGGGSAITVNKIVYRYIPTAATITAWHVICDQDSGTTGIIITPYKDAYATDTLPTTTMCATGTPPHTSDGATAGGIAHNAAWDCNVTTLAAGDVIAFKVTTAPTSATWCTVSLEF